MSNKQDDKQENKKSILVMNGCGVKGIAFMGALQALDDLNLLNNFDTFACSSASGWIIGIYLLGYSGKELYEIYRKLDGSSFGFISDPLNIFKNFHVSNFNVFELVFNKLAKNKNINPDITLKEFYELNKKTFIVTSTCINEKKVYYVSYKTFPDIKVIDAIKMTIAVPLYYPPVIYNNKMFVDGGCIDNFPIRMFDSELDKVVGIYIESVIVECDKFNDIFNYINGIIDCFKVSYNKLTTDKYSKYIITIPINQNNFLEFSISNDKKDELYNTGYKVIKDYYK